MCVPGCEEIVARNLSRREFVSGLTAGGVALASAGCSLAETDSDRGASSPRGSASSGGDSKHSDSKQGADSRDFGAEPSPPSYPAFSRIVDLTHTYSNEFPHYRGGGSQVDIEALSTSEKDGWNVNRWTLDEHGGTHIDAPFHRNGKGMRAHELPAQDLVLPLAVVDIRKKAETDDDAQVTLEDIKSWEAEHGQLPDRACLALLSGWDKHVASKKFINFDDQGARHFPGFHLEAIQFVLEERNVISLASDTASLDYGPTVDYPVHTLWLGANRWGLENAAKLDELPARGATIVCGAPKIQGVSGGPSRVFALV